MGRQRQKLILAAECSIVPSSFYFKWFFSVQRLFWPNDQMVQENSQMPIHSSPLLNDSYEFLDSSVDSCCDQIGDRLKEPFEESKLLVWQGMIKRLCRSLLKEFWSLGQEHTNLLVDLVLFS